MIWLQLFEKQQHASHLAPNPRRFTSTVRTLAPSTSRWRSMASDLPRPIVPSVNTRWCHRTASKMRRQTPSWCVTVWGRRHVRTPSSPNPSHNAVRLLWLTISKSSTNAFQVSRILPKNKELKCVGYFIYNEFLQLHRLVNENMKSQISPLCSN